MEELDKAQKKFGERFSTAINDFDYVAARVAVATGVGGLAGASVGIYRGHNVPRVTQTMAMNFAMTATACIGSQRLALAAGRTLIPLKKGETPSSKMILASHGIGGIVGGGILGALYIGKPVRGMVLLVPTMLFVGLLELRFQEHKRKDPNEDKKNELQVTRHTDGSSIVQPRK
jgi:hypothetical protein